MSLPALSVRFRVHVVIVACSILLASSEMLRAAEPAVAITLSVAEREAIATAFAPTLIFHPLETYFPTRAMTLSHEGGSPDDWQTRVAKYEGLTQEAKLRQVALGYRVFSRVHRGRTEVVAEYWCYYVYNQFTVRGTWLPYRVADNHPHDLERLFVVLSPIGAAEPETVPDVAWARRSFELRSIIANAHDGSIPANEYDTRNGAPVTLPLSILVERGSHAMAPDINHDGQFTPGIDATATKLLWGIRDRGVTWGRYRSRFMEPRDASAIRLCGPARPEEKWDGCPTYELYSAESVRVWFDGLQLTQRERHGVLGTTPWLLRTFGDVKVDQLMVPRDPADGHVLDQMRRRGPAAENGLFVGFTTAGHSPALVVGQRAAWSVASTRLPNIVAEAVAVLPTRGTPIVETTLWGSYSFDAITNWLVGASWTTEFQRLDPLIGTDLRVGRFRVQPTINLRSASPGARVTTSF